MSEETYYTVLNVKETASLSEIKTAYRDLIKQVHPDTIASLAPYLRRIAEDKTKEIIEAYAVLSNSSKRRDYDSQLEAYRRQNARQPSPPSHQLHHRPIKMQQLKLPQALIAIGAVHLFTLAAFVPNAIGRCAGLDTIGAP
jgi:curved DNA-binding protein CbpA